MNKRNRGKSHNLEIKDAIKYGVNEAIMLESFRHWIDFNTNNHKNFHDGRTWTFNSVEAFGLTYPYWSKGQINRILNSLISQNVIVTGNYNKLKTDRTRWYAFLD